MKQALLIIDYTESCCSERFERPRWGCTLSAVRAMAPRMTALVESYRRAGNGEVVWIVCCPWSKGHVHPNIESLYGRNPAAQFYTDGTGSRDFYAAAPIEGERVFEKNLYSAFSGTAGGLDRYLKLRDISHLLISGVYSTGCVNATVCEAFHHGYRLSIVRDCVETFDRKASQEYQKALLRDWQYMYADIITSKEAALLTP